MSTDTQAPDQPTPKPPAAPKGRRQWITLAAAGGAALAGGLWWGNRQPADPAEKALASLWPLELPTPGGAVFSLRALQGRPLLLNFWATWCGPCVKEMPLLDAFAREHGAQGWQVLGLALEEAGPVQRFLAKTPVGFPIVLAGVQGLALARDLGNAQGGLPFSVVINARSEIVARQLGPTNANMLQAWSLLR